MERERPGAGRVRPGPAVVLVAIAVAIALIGCASNDVAATPTPTTATLRPAPTATPRPAPTATPTEPAPTDDASVDPGASPTESAAASDNPAVACTGTADNRAFLVTVAGKFTWDVYCAVLAKGWNVEKGSYRTTSGGGWLTMAYKGPGGRRFELREGAFCTQADGCVPAGSEIASGPLGDREGAVIAAADGSFAIVVDRGSKISWLAIGKGVDEATFRAQAEAVTLVGD